MSMLNYTEIVENAALCNGVSRKIAFEIYIYLAKIILLRQNLLFMAEFFNFHQKLFQGTND